MHEVDDPPSPSNDVDDGDQRALARFGCLLLASALTRSHALHAGYAPPPAEQARLCALGVAAFDALIANDAGQDAASVGAGLVTGPPPGWMESVLHQIEEREARGPTSQERFRLPSWESIALSERAPLEPLQQDVLYLPSELVARIDRCAREARTLLGCEVLRETVVRAAVAAWLGATDTRPMSVELESIRQSLRPITTLDPYPQRWPSAMALRLDLIANTACRALFCEVSRSTVVRAALASCLEDAENTWPKEDAAEEIPTALVTYENQVES